MRRDQLSFDPASPTFTSTGFAEGGANAQQPQRARIGTEDSPGYNAATAKGVLLSAVFDAIRIVASARGKVDGIDGH